MVGSEVIFLSLSSEDLYGFQLSDVVPMLKKKIKTKADAEKVAEALKSFEQERGACEARITAILSQISGRAAQRTLPERA